VPNWSLATFKAEAIEIYRDVCTAIAAGDAASLRHKATESQLTDIKRYARRTVVAYAASHSPPCRELKRREAGGWARVKWELVEVLECSVVHGRLVAPNPKDTANSWAQMTVALKSTQRFSAYDARGKLVSGDPAQLLQVQDYWVLERAMIVGMPDGLKRWRLAARMTLPATA
jgi:large subunit ribosomal protein L45